MTALKRPIQISTLEEDMRNIFGRPLREQDDSQEEPAPEYPEDGGNLAEPDEDPPMGEADDDEDEPVDEDDDEDEDDEPVDAEEAKSQISSLANGFLSAHTRARVESRSRRGQKKGKGGRSLSEGRRGPKSPKSPKRKPFRKPQQESKAARVLRLARGDIFESAPAPRRRSTTRSSRVASLLEEVQGIVGDLHRSRRVEQIQGFANIAVIAGMLEGRFRSIGMDLAEGNIYRVAGEMKKLSEQASDVAVGLDSPDEEPTEPTEQDELPGDDDQEDPMPTAEAEADDAAVDDMFKKLMAKLLDALQLYNDVTGKEEMDGMPDLDDEPSDGDDEEDVVSVGEQDDDDEPTNGNGNGNGYADEDDDEDEYDDEEPATEDADPSAGGSGGAPPDGPYGRPDEEGDAMSESLRIIRRMRRR